MEAPPHGPAIRAAIDRARAEHPGLDAGDDTLAARLEAIVAGSPDPEAAIEGLHLGDLFLACACARGDAAAVAVLERDHLGPARAAVARILDTGEGDDVMQSVCEKLLVGSGGREGGHPHAPGAPRIAEYTGRGTLAGWIKVIAVRAALSRVRRARSEPPPPDDEALLDLPSPLHPELDHMRARYRGEFKAAFQEALAGLEARDRTLLRLQFVDDLTVDQIGALYRVHRSTAARWAARARESLFDETRRLLAMRLGVDASQLASIVELVRSHVDLSLLRFLDEDGGDPAQG